MTKEGHLRFLIHALLVEAPGIRLVVDTCVGNDRPRGMTGGVALATGFLKSFADAGWREVVSLATRVAEDDASAACGPQLRTERIGLRTAVLRDPHDE